MKLFEVYERLDEGRIEKTAEKYGEKLHTEVYQDFGSDEAPWLLEYSCNGDYHCWMERFIDEEYLIKNDIGDLESIQIDATYFYKEKYLEALVANFAKYFDPTPNNKYLDWIVRTYSKGAQFSVEDYEMVYDTIRIFDQYKSALDQKDINQYKDYGELSNAVDSVRGEASTVDKAEAIKNGDAEILHEAGDERLVKINSLKGAKAFSKGTEWCTQYPNMYEHYSSQGPIYIIDTNDPKFRIQIHFESEQAMDVNDRFINTDVTYHTYETYRWLLNYRAQEIESMVRREPLDYIIEEADFVLILGMPVDWFYNLLDKAITTPKELQTALKKVQIIGRSSRFGRKPMTEDEYQKALELLNNKSEELFNS